jgi:hypothetical protein
MLGRACDACGHDGPNMLLKIIALLAAAIPVILFLRKIFVRRPSRLGATLREFKQQVDLAIYIFLGIVGCVVVFALGKIAWTWWTAV